VWKLEVYSISPALWGCDDIGDHVILDPEDAVAQRAIFERVVELFIRRHQPTIQLPGQGHVQAIVDRPPGAHGDLQGRL
jgi:hypothetical protein